MRQRAVGRVEILAAEGMQQVPFESSAGRVTVTTKVQLVAGVRVRKIKWRERGEGRAEEISMETM